MNLKATKPNTDKQIKENDPFVYLHEKNVLGKQTQIIVWAGYPESIIFFSSMTKG